MVKLWLGRYVHNGRALLVDNVTLNQRTTLQPTPLPTFNPTISKNSGPTSEPTRHTSSPTTAIVVSCPLVGDAPVRLLSTSVILSLASSGTLCTLTKVFTSEAGEMISVPIARSHDTNLWEKSAGDFAASVFIDKNILCYDAGCQVNLPSLELGSKYILSSYNHTLTKENEIARFLETSTFGITQDMLHAFSISPNNTKDAIASWLFDQMDSDIIPMTSHREYWRKGLNGRQLSPDTMGVPNHPCSAHSKWRRMSFVHNDYRWWMEKKLRILETGPFVIEFNGWTRTVVNNIVIDHSDYVNYSFDPSIVYSLCGSPEESLDGKIRIQLEDETCVMIENPVVNLSGYEDRVSTIFNLNKDDISPIDTLWNNEGDELVFISQKSLFDDESYSTICNGLPLVPDLGDEPIFAKLSDGTWLMFDPRIQVDHNTLDSPIFDGGKAVSAASGGNKFCSNVPRSFLNEDQCQISSDSCKTSSNNDIEITIDNSTIATLNVLTGRYVYAIKGMLVKYDGIILEHPCTPGLRSRWEPKNSADCNPTELYSGTNSSLSYLLNKSNDRNPYIRDIIFPDDGLTCNVTDTEPEIEIEVAGTCFKRVHDEYMSVFDMTYWVDNHPGGSNAIMKWSENNGTTLVYPSLLPRQPHGMSRWNNNWHKFTYIGRFGDKLRVGDLPNDLRRVEVLDYFDDSVEAGSSLSLVCGSPGEIQNDATKGFKFDASTAYQTVPWYVGDNRKYVWMMVGLSASDQLRQRVAWTLAQVSSQLLDE